MWLILFISIYRSIRDLEFTMRNHKIFSIGAVLILLILLVGGVAADTQTLEGNVTNLVQGYAISNPGSSTTAQLLMITLNKPEYLNELTYISANNVGVQFVSPHVPDDLGGWNSHATISSTSGMGTTNISEGTITFTLLTNTSTVGYFQVTYQPTTINFTGMSGSYQNLHLYYTQPASWTSGQASFYMGSLSIPSSQTYAFFSNKSGATNYYFSGGPAITGPSDSTSWIYNFKNIINVTNNGGAYEITAQRNFGSKDYHSYLTIYDSIGSFLTTTGGWTDVSVTSFSPPIYATIWDGYTGTNWSHAFYYPNLTLTVNPTTAGTAQVLSMNLQSSTGFFPSDISRVIYRISPEVDQLKDVNATTQHILDFQLIGSTWYQWDGSAYNLVKGATIPSAVSTQITSPGNYSAYVSYTSSITGIETNTPGVNVTILGTSKIGYSWIPIDSSTGGFVSGATVSVYSSSTHTWTNHTVYKTSDCLFYLDPGYYTAYASASNYPQVSTSLENIQVAGSENIPLAATVPGLLITNTTVNAFVTSTSTGSGIYNAQILFIPGPASITTNGGGVGSALVLNNTQYKVMVNAAGYLPVTKYITTSSASYSLTVSMSPGSSTGNVVTTSPTGAIPTIAGGGTGTTGNYTGFWGPIANGLETMGAAGPDMGILLTAFLVFVGFIVGGFGPGAINPGAPFNGGIGMVGGVFGFILSVGFGFISIVYVVAAILCGAFIMIFFRSG
jgi:hypothetical protein